MIFAISPASLTKDRVPIYWTRQHGAVITLITAWLCATLAGGLHGWSQVVAGLFLISGFHLTELATEALRRNSPLPLFRRRWLYGYTLITLCTGLAVWFRIPLIHTLLLPMAIAGLVFAALGYLRLHKSSISEWLTFSAFAMAGLLAYNNVAVPAMSNLFFMWACMSLYFGVSVFNVKVRFGRVRPFWPLLYATVAGLLLLLLMDSTPVVLLISLLMVLKSVPASVFPKWYRTWNVKTVGLAETAAHLVFILLFVIHFHSIA